MKFKKTEPSLYIYAPNRTTQYGVIPVPVHLNINYRFNTFSEMQFEIRKYYYNDRKEKWVRNPLYDMVEKNNLVKIPNDNPVFKYKIDELYEDNEYDLPRNEDGTPDYSQQWNRISTEARNGSALYYPPTFNHCTFSPETELFDVGSIGGYGWKSKSIIRAYINDDAALIPSRSGYIETGNGANNLANETFFPIQIGDIIVYGCSKNSNGYYVKNANFRKYGFCTYYYSESDSSHCTHIGNGTNNNNDFIASNPVSRYLVKEGFLGDYSWAAGHRHNYIQNGYVRFSGIDVSSGHSATYYSTPNEGYLKILSGERRCERIIRKRQVVLTHGIPWWVIVNVEKEEDGINPVKKVTAYSYEYTLINRSFSIDDDTLPLYIPDNIPKVVASDEFPIDKWDGVTYCGAQRMKRGLVNQILDNLSGWKVRYISYQTCTRYRQIENVDNANIYTFLMNIVQSKYQCFIIFDVENLYINILDYGVMVKRTTPNGTMVIQEPAIEHSEITIDWRNALKSMSIKNIDDNYATALRVHSEEDTYGLGLVNPNGSNIIYNFQNIINSLDYVVDPNHLDENNNPYTLKQLVEKYQNDISSTSNDSDLTEYRTYALDLITNNIRVVEFESKLSERLTEYKRAVDKNNILTQIQYNVNSIPELPPTSDEFVSGARYHWGQTTAPSSTLGYHTEVYEGAQIWVKNIWESRGTYEQIKTLAENYWDAYNNYNTYQGNISRDMYNMKNIALKYSLNINTLNKQFAANNVDGVPTSGYKPIFTPTEAIELFKYIYESDWTNENVVFNEEYSANDIYNTLVDLYDTASIEMGSIYSKPTQDFETNIVNITRIPEMKNKCESLYLGSSLYIRSDEKWVEPILLEIKIDYDDYNYSPMVFTTDYNRKPSEMRFYELFSTIQQTSVQTPTYTFDN